MIPKSRLSFFLSPFLWLIPFCCFLAGYFAFSLFLSRSSLSTPAVVGLSLQEALDTLAKKNLNARLLSHKEDAHLPAGTIVSQNPSAGSSIRPQQTVFIISSIVPPPAALPNCVGERAESAFKKLDASEIPYKAFFVPSNHPHGTCIAQLPAAHQILHTGSLTLYISQNPKQDYLIVPSFEGKPVHEVTQFLAASNIPFSLFHGHAVESTHDCTECQVVGQKPGAGSCIDRSAPPTVQLKVND